MCDCGIGRIPGYILWIQRYMRIVVNKKYKLIQVMGTLYRYISFTAV